MLPLLAATAWLAAAQTNPCDLNGDNAVDVVDVQMAVAMRAGQRPCRANVAGLNVCNDTVVERVRAASLSGRCGQNRSAVLTWTASPSPNVAGYNVYRALASRGPYTRLTPLPVSGTSFTDTAVESGRLYYYVTTSVNTSGLESAFSVEAAAAIPP